MLKCKSDCDDRGLTGLKNYSSSSTHSGFKSCTSTKPSLRVVLPLLKLRLFFSELPPTVCGVCAGRAARSTRAQHAPGDWTRKQTHTHEGHRSHNTYHNTGTTCFLPLPSFPPSPVAWTFSSGGGFENSDSNISNFSIFHFSKFFHFSFLTFFF